MKILVCIAHFFNANGSGKYGSVRKDSRPRIQALSASLQALHTQFGLAQGMIHIGNRRVISANDGQKSTLDVVICTTQEKHLLGELLVPKHFYTHCPTNAEPMLLGFECQAKLRENLGKYDYYCFLEDDLIIHDPWFFRKLEWFLKCTRPQGLLQPNRFEQSSHGPVHKIYVDGDLRAEVTAPFQNVAENREFIGKVMGTPVRLVRALNPHSGCYFLSHEQMEFWVKKPYFLDHNTSFIGPLESAASLGIMRTFRVYKPAPECASFFEIEHFGTSFLRLVGNHKMPIVDSLARNLHSLAAVGQPGGG